MNKAKKKTSSGKVRILSLFFGIGFLVTSTPILYSLIYQPLILYYQSSDWMEGVCTITSSKMEGKYKHIIYSYDFNGQSYSSDRCCLTNVNSGSLKSNRELVRKYRPNNKVPCYINPDQPHTALLTRKLGFYQIAVGAIFCIMPAIGIIIVFAAIFYKEQSESTTPTTAQIELHGSYRLIGFIVTLLSLCILSLVLYSPFKEIGQGWISGENPIGATLLLAPFLVFWLLLLYGTPYTFMQLWNPRITLLVPSSGFTIGREEVVGWKVVGKTAKLQELKFSIQCKRISNNTQGRGKNRKTHTSEKELYNQELETVMPPRSFEQGQIRVKIPSDAKSSSLSDSESQSTEVIWTINVHGKIDNLPDLDEVFVIEVL